MKIYLYVLFLLYSSLAHAQLRMDILNLNISKLTKSNDYQSIIPNGDTLSIQIIQENSMDSPYFNIVAQIKNISNLDVTLYPNSSQLFISYRYKNKQLKNNLFFDIKIEDDALLKNYFILKPNQEIQLSACGYLINRGSIEEIQFKKMEDYRDALLEILPTLKFHYQGKAGVEVTHSDILNVEVQRNLVMPKPPIPFGYYIIPQ